MGPAARPDTLGLSDLVRKGTARPGERAPSMGDGTTRTQRHPRGRAGTRVIEKDWRRRPRFELEVGLRSKGYLSPVTRQGGDAADPVWRSGVESAEELTVRPLEGFSAEASGPHPKGWTWHWAEAIRPLQPLGGPERMSSHLAPSVDPHGLQVRRHVLPGYLGLVDILGGTEHQAGAARNACGFGRPACARAAAGQWRCPRSW